MNMPILEGIAQTWHCGNFRVEQEVGLVRDSHRPGRNCRIFVGKKGQVEVTGFLSIQPKSVDTLVRIHTDEIFEIGMKLILISALELFVSHEFLGLPSHRLHIVDNKLVQIGESLFGFAVVDNKAIPDGLQVRVGVFVNHI